MSKIRISITLSEENLILMEKKEIKNISGFIDDLITDALTDDKFFLKQKISRINDIKKEIFNEHGIELLFDLKKPKEGAN